MSELPQEKPLHEHPSFSEFITDLDHGKIDQTLTAKLAELVAAVEDNHKKGKLTLTIHVKPENKMAQVSVEYKLDKPQPPLHGTLFHIGLKGALLREDPRQMKLKNLDDHPRVVRDLENPQ